MEYQVVELARQTIPRPTRLDASFVSLGPNGKILLPRYGMAVF